MSPTTLAIKSALWKMHGDPAYPAEWDGNVLGGGKLSQRFWEYFAAIDALDLSPESVVLDIGGGSPDTGISIFPKVIAPSVRQVVVMDAALRVLAPPDKQLELIQENCTYDSLRRVFSEFPQISHVASVSVFEHIPPDVREGIVKAIDDHFLGSTFVVTLEFNSNTSFFDHQLTMRSLSDTFSPLKHFFPVEFIQSPVPAGDALRGWRPIYARLAQKLMPGRRIFRNEITPQIEHWRPILLKFLRG